MRYGSGSQSISDTQNSGTIESHVYNHCEIQMTPSQTHSSDTESAEGMMGNTFNLLRRNEHFVGRKVESRAIEQAFSGNSQVLYVLHGLGGVGKTQLANAFLLEHQDEYQLTVRIRAEQIKSLQDDLIRLGEYLDLTFHRRNRKDKAIETIDYLSNRFEGNMLLLYDNVTSYDDVKDFIPANSQQHVLLTSRSRNGWDSCSSHEIQSMKNDEAVSLLEKLVSEATFRQEKPKVLDQLVKELGCLPLAIAQAGVYIREHSITIAKYLEHYQAHKRTLMSSKEPADYDNPVYVTFDLNIQYLQQENSLALSLLDRCAYCCAEDIPEWFLKSVLDIDDVTFNESKQCLNQFSLVDFDASEKVSMHRVLQAVRREKHLEESNSETLTSLLSWLADNYIYDYDKNSSEYCKLLPHASSIVDFIDCNNEAQRKLPHIDITIYYALGLFYLDYEYDAKKAKDYFDRALCGIDTISDDRLKAKIYRQYAKTLFRINPDDSKILEYYKSASELEPSLLGKFEFDQQYQKFQAIISSNGTNIRGDIEKLEAILQALNRLIPDASYSDEMNYIEYTQLKVIMTLLDKIERLIELREHDRDQLASWKTDRRQEIEEEIRTLEQKSENKRKEAKTITDKLLEELDNVPPKIRAQQCYQTAKFQFCHHKTGKETLSLIKNAWTLREYFQEDHKIRMLNLYSDILCRMNKRQDAIGLLETVKEEFSSDNQNELQKKIEDIKSQSSITSFLKKLSDTVGSAFSSGSSAAANAQPPRPKAAPSRYRQPSNGGLFTANSTANSRKRRSTDSKNNERSSLKSDKKIQRVSSQDSASYS